MRLAALVVSHRSAGFALTCVRSLAAEWARLGEPAGALDVVVVDNPASISGAGERRAELAALEALEDEGALVVTAPYNLGYAGGVELGRSLARPADAWLVLNPDLVFLPGSLRPLLEAADANGAVGAVAPRTFVDIGCTLAHPPLLDWTPGAHWRRTLAEVHPGCARAEAARRARAALNEWQASGPYEARALSGACLLVPEPARRALNGLLLDPRYPLYHEDDDLARRLRLAGRSLTVVPASRVVHHWARSTGVGADFAGDPARRLQASRRRWFERWYPGLGRRLAAAADELLASWSGARGPALHPTQDLGALEAPPELALARPAGPRGFVLEVSLTPHFALAAGQLGQPGLPGTGAHARLSRECFEWFFPGRVYLRALDRESLDCLGAWSFEKLVPARARPVSLEELEPQADGSGARTTTSAVAHRAAARAAGPGSGRAWKSAEDVA